MPLPRPLYRASPTAAILLIAILIIAPVRVGPIANGEIALITITQAAADDVKRSAVGDRQRAKKRRQIRKQKKRSTQRERQRRRRLISQCRQETDMTDAAEIKKSIRECVAEKESG